MDNQNTTRRSTGLLIIIVTVLSITAGAIFNQVLLKQGRDTQAPTGIEATVLNTARSLTPFNLVDHHNRPFNLDSFKGKWDFIFFGFTNCPDVCPTTLKVMQQAWKKLPQDKPKPNMIFFSVDPDRDNTKLLKEYVTYYHPDFIGVTGNLDQIDNITGQLGILYGYDENKEDNPQDYTVNHSAYILLIDPQARLRAVFSPPYDATSVSHAFNTIRDFYQD